VLLLLLASPAAAQDRCRKFVDAATLVPALVDMR
jgi:hypothetical protein